MTEKEKDLHELANEATPWESAENAKPLPKTYFGHVMMNSWFCVLVKGVGKVPFEPGNHNVSQRRTAVDISIAPLPSSGQTFTIERNIIAESRAWANTILPSIKTLGISPRELNEKYARYEMVPTGRTFTGRTGEKIEETMPKFLGVYNTLEEAEVAAAALYSGNGSGEDQADAPTGGNGNARRDTAAKFLPALWAGAGNDVTKLQQLIASNPLVSEFFDISSPEVVELVSGSA